MMQDSQFLSPVPYDTAVMSFTYPYAIITQYNITVFSVQNHVSPSSAAHMLKPKHPMWQYLETKLRRRQLKLNEVIRVGPWSHRISVVIRETSESSLLLSLHANELRKGHMRTKWPSESKEEDTCLKTNQLEPWSWTFQPTELWENKCLLVKHPPSPVCGLL